MSSLLLVMIEIVSLLFYKDNFGIKYSTKVNMPLNKETKEYSDWDLEGKPQLWRFSNEEVPRDRVKC